jgi:hypothetical protein
MNAQAPIKLPTIKLPVSNPVLMTAADLPARIGRWTPIKKIMVIEAIRAGLITKEAALQRYGIGADEFGMWLTRYQGHGREGLKSTVRPGVPKPVKRTDPELEDLQRQLGRLSAEVERLRRARRMR